VFVTVKPFRPSVMFADKAGAYPLNPPSNAPPLA